MVVVWWASEVECASAVARLEREKRSSRAATERALERLAELAASWTEVSPHDDLRSVARRLLRTHPLRAADALPLAAALAAAERGPLSLVCLDRRLREAASIEGLALLP